MQRKTHKYIFKCEVCEILLESDNNEEPVKHKIFKKFYALTSVQIFDNWASHLENVSPLISHALIDAVAANNSIIDELLNFILTFLVENNNMYITGKYVYIIFDKESRLFLELNKKIRKYIESE